MHGPDRQIKQFMLDSGAKLHNYAPIMHKYEATAKVAIVGARGYTGQELARLLLTYPAARLTACFSTDALYKLSDLLPEPAAANVPVLRRQELVSTKGLDAVF